MTILVGSDVTNVISSTAYAASGATFGLGDRYEATDGKLYVFVQADSAIAANDAVAIDETYQARKITTALAEDGHKVGVAPVAFADDDYGFIQVRGVCSLNVAGNYAVDGVLYTTGTAGVLDDAVATTLARIHGLIGTAAGTTGATTVAAFMAIEPFADKPTG